MATAPAEPLDQVPEGLVAPPDVPPVPKSLWSSFSAWWSYSQLQAAQAELYLYSKSGYFRGARLGNADACEDNGPDTLAQAYAIARSGAAKESALPPHGAAHNRYSTVGTECAPDGKVGCVRLVDIGDAPERSAHTSTRRLPSFSPTYKRRQLNMLEVGTPQEHAAQPADEKKIVLVHGYGAGSAFFFPNVEAFAPTPNSRFFALDWLGMGRSSRTPYRLPRRGMKLEDRVHAAEAFFVDSLEQWRDKMRLERMVLVGHSLGGYLSLAYALQYPERVSQLILVSPVGIPEGSWDQMHAKAPRAEAPLPQEQLERDVEESVLQRTGTTDSRSTEADRGPNARMTRAGTSLRRIVSVLWEWNVSPFGIVRNSFFLGPWLMGRYTSRRFGTLSAEEVRYMHAYCHGITTDRGSSEYSLSHLLAPGAYARLPMVNRISGLKMPISFLYGSHDWMDINGGIDACKRLREAGNRHTGVHIISHAGHHLYLDNPGHFNQLIMRLVQAPDNA